VEPLDIFKAYDIRGTYPDQLDERVARAIGSAFAQFASAPRIVIARDMRPSGVSLVRAFAEGIRALGVEVLDAGLSSTDFLYFAAGRLDAPGAMFTASHNPAQYNGIKLCRSGARPIGAGSGLEEIKAMTATYFDHPATGELAPVSNVDLMGEWVAHVHSFVDTSKLRPLRIVADTANGMGGFVVPRVFAGLPFEVEIMYEELDGTFPNHPADPLNPENLKDLQRRVLETRADIGMAFDGDADRVFLLDEKAQPISGSTTTAMVAATLLERNPGATILYNLICSKSVPEIITERGGTAVRTRVGHSFIKQVMAETDALFGGEHSGHYYYRQNYCADSGIITALIVLELLSRASQPMSELVAPFERYVGSGEINTKVSSPGQTVSTIAHRLAGEDAKLDLTDGLTADFDSWWFNLRPSNTEPLLRLNVEASDQAQCAQRVTEVLTMIREAQE
jgi:phosphomannomutase